MFTICIYLRFRDSFTIQATVIYLNSQIISDKSALTFDLHQPPRVCFPDLADPSRQIFPSLQTCPGRIRPVRASLKSKMTDLFYSEYRPFWLFLVKMTDIQKFRAKMTVY